MMLAALGALRAAWTVRAVRRIALGVAVPLVLWAGWAAISARLRSEGAARAERSANIKVEAAQAESAALATQLAAAYETARRAQEIANAAAQHADTLRHLDAATWEARRRLDVAASTLRAAAPPAAIDAPPVGPDAVVDPALSGALRGAVERLRHAADTVSSGYPNSSASATGVD